MFQEDRQRPDQGPGLSGDGNKTVTLIDNVRDRLLRVPEEPDLRGRILLRRSFNDLTTAT